MAAARQGFTESPYLQQGYALFLCEKQGLKQARSIMLRDPFLA